MKLTRIIENADIDIDWILTNMYLDEAREHGTEERVRAEMGTELWMEVEKVEEGSLAFEKNALLIDIVGHYNEKDEVTSGEMTEEEAFMRDVERIRSKFPWSRILYIGSFDAGGCGKVGENPQYCGFDWHRFRGNRK